MRMRYAPDAGGVWRRPGFAGLGYSDGPGVEERLLGIVTNATRLDTFSPELAGAITDWPSEYHLSRARHCLLRPLAIGPPHRVLELGCGCGALTRYLGETGAAVVAVEGSAARARIAAARCRDLAGVRVVCDSLLDFEAEDRFDWVVLVGVLEYAPLFCGAPSAMAHYLRRAARFLGPAGRLLVAMENQFGLKYFNGCAEDHVGIPFFGVEGLYRDRSPVTCGRRELARRVRACGLGGLEWYYPFPDYKLPSVVVSARALRTDLNVPDLLVRAPSRDYGGHAMRLFEEALALAALHRGGLVEELSNSFMLVAGRGRASVAPSGALAWTYAVHRHERFATETAFVADGGRIRVVKARLAAPCDAPAVPGEPPDVRQVLRPAAYRRGRLSVWRALEANARNASLEEMVDAFQPWFDDLRARAAVVPACAGAASARPARLADWQIDGSLIDCTPFNVIENGHGLCLIDQEWQWPGAIPLGHVVCRGVLHSLTLLLARLRTYDLVVVVEGLCARRGLAVGGEEIAGWLERELAFLKAVGGPVPAAAALWSCRSHLVALYPELVRLVQQSSVADAGLAELAALREAQRAAADRHAAEITAVQSELAASRLAHAEEASLLRRACDSQARTLAGLLRDLADQGAAIDALCCRAREQRRDRERMAAELAAACAERDEARRDRARARDAVEALETARRLLTASTSWRITAPLRALKTELNALAGRLRPTARRCRASEAMCTGNATVAPTVVCDSSRT
jgi:SAM-dependent methyltransferase